MSTYINSISPDLQCEAVTKRGHRCGNIPKAMRDGQSLCARHLPIKSVATKPAAELLRPDKYLEVGHTPDEREIVVNIPMDELCGSQHLVFSPSQARNLARLLLRKAEECKP